MSNKNHKSPLVCCVICKKEKSAKGIHSHHRISHTEEGKIKHQQKSAIASVNGGAAFAKKMARIKEENIKQYKETLNRCKHCDDILPFEKRQNDFCSSSCSASYHNKNNIKSIATKQKISNTLKNKTPKPPYSKVKVCHCEICNNSFIWNEYKRGSARFCSNTCSYIHRSNVARNNPNLGVKRSKDEIKLYNLCKNYFKKVTSNEKLFNNWDADILIYDYKLSILWNGPWHYKEMNFGNHSLKQTQNRDKIKISEMKKLNWNVLIFEDRYYTPETAFDAVLQYTNQLLIN